MMFVKRVVRSLQFGLWSQPKSMPYGPKLYGDPLDGTFQMIARGAYGDFTIKSLLASPSNCVFLDIGANIGYFSVALAEHFSGNIYCFEPNVRTFSYLQKNLKQGCIDTAVALCMGVSDSNQVSALLNNKRFHSGAATLVSSFGDQTERVTLIGPMLLKAILPETGEFVAKIDVEGAELGVVKALHRAGILDKMERMIIEMSVGTNTREQLDEIRDILIASGLCLVERSGSEHFGDELFVRKKAI